MEKTTEELINALAKAFEGDYVDTELVLLAEQKGDYRSTEIAFVSRRYEHTEYVCQFLATSNHYRLVRLTPIHDNGFLDYYKIDEIAQTIQVEK